MASMASARALGTARRSQVPIFVQRRSMTRGRSVRDRSKRKRWHHLEVAARRHKAATKLIAVMDLLKGEEEHVIPARRLEALRSKLGLWKPHRAIDFVRKSPRLFQFCRDSAGGYWCGLTDEAEELVEEEAVLLEQNSEAAALRVAKLLMMSADRRLELDKIVHFRRDFGLLPDFRERWVHGFPEMFRQVRFGNSECLELVSWRPELAVTELEKRRGDLGSVSPTRDISVPFPLHFPPKFETVHRHWHNIEHFQSIAHRSPYADAQGLEKGSKEFDKRAVAVMHEILSLTLEKRVVTDHLTHFRREFTMPQKLMRLLLKHCGIFYVSETGKRFSVFLTDAYNGPELKEKCPLVLWKEKLLQFSGFAGWRGKKLGLSGDQSDAEDFMFGDQQSRDIAVIGVSDDDAADELFDESLLEEDSEMDAEILSHCSVLSPDDQIEMLQR